MARKDLSKDPTNLQAMWRKAKKFYYELKKIGLSDTVVAAILGNIAQESSFDPKARAGSYSGYIQNQKEIVNWVIKHFGGYDHIHLMNYLIAGLTLKLPDKVSLWGKELNTRFNTFLQGLTNNITVAQATKLWENSYEKSGGQSLQQRINYANYFYKQILEGNKTTPVRKTPKIKLKNKTIAYQIPETAYPLENSKFLEPLQEYIAQTNNTYGSFPLFFDFKNYLTPETYEPQSVDQTKTEFDLPVYASNFKKGGKLIKRGQQGTTLHKTIYLKKDGNESESPHSELKSWIADITPEERMDLTTLLLNELVSTYLPTKELQLASLGIKHPFSWWEAIPTLAPIVVPAAIATGPEIGATLINPAFWGNLIKDTALYTATDAASEGMTGKGIGAHVNNAIGLEEGHPVGEAIGFTGTSLFEKPLEKGIISAYKGLRGTILPEYALSLAMNESLWKPYVSRIVQENGKIRLRLPSHTDATPREVVLEPQGNNKFYVHVRTWDGEKIPANLSERDKGYLYEALYNELPEGAEILFPESGPDNYATRGTVAGLQKLGRDPRFSKGSSGTLLYIDKDGSIKEFTGTSFIKTPTNTGYTITYKSTIPTVYDNDWYHYGVIPVQDTYFRPMQHVLGDAAVLMFKEYGGIEIPDIPIKKEIYGYVPEARVRYGLERNNNITDDEIAQALYKEMLENNVISHEEWGPMIGFRGTTRRSNYLHPHKQPQEFVNIGGTMDNSLGTLFLAQLPHKHPTSERFLNPGVNRYLVTGKIILSDTNPNYFDIKINPSETTGIGVVSDFPRRIPIINSPKDLWSKYFQYLLGDPNMLISKVKPEYVTSGVNDLNAYMFRTPYLRDISRQMTVGEWDRTFDPNLKFEWLTTEKPVYIDEDGPVRASYKGHSFLMHDSGTEQGFLRLLIADLYDAIHEAAQKLQLGLYFSKRNSPFRGEHRDYLFLTLPQWNIRNAKHILPYDLRLPRLWGDPNVYLKMGGKLIKRKKN